MSSPAVARWSRRVLFFLLSAAILLATAWIWLDWTEQIVTVRPRMGEIEGSEILRLDASGANMPLGTFPPGLKPRNVIVLIADGLGFSHLVAGRAQLAGLSGRLFVEQLPVVGWQMTWSEERLITDSAASATAMATGFKARNGAISQTSDERLLPTVLEQALEQGMRGGLITDSYLWDATPAAFIAHVASRGQSEQILNQMAASKASLLIGGRGRIEPSSDRGKNVQSTFEEKGWQVVWQWSDEASNADDKMVALLPRDSIADESQVPHLADLADLALKRLEGASGFLLMVETEETDTASHAHDFARLVRGLGKWDETVRRAVDYAARQRDTLVLVTSDHETGGLALISGSPDHEVGVSWATTSHSAEPVPIFAYGPGAELFAGILDNTDIARRISDLLDLGMF